MTAARRADLAFFVSAAGALLLLAFFGALGQRLGMIGNDDLSRIWAGPRALLTGADPYDPRSWAATAAALGTLAPDTPVYIYPPWVTLVLLPLAALPLPLASIVWLGGSLLVGLTGLRLLLRTYLPGRPLAHAVTVAMLLLSWVGALSLIIGQWGLILVGATSAVIVWLDTHPGGAGATAASFIAKPQLFLCTAPALAIRALWPVAGRISRAGRRFILSAVALTVVLVAMAWIVIPSWWPTWIVRIGATQLKPDSDTIPGLLYAVFGPTGSAFAPVVVLPLLGLGLAFHPRAAAWPAVWPILSLLVTPYTNSYDQILLIVPIVIASGVASRRSARAGAIVLGGGALVLLVITPFMYELAIRRHSETFGALVPLAIFALIVTALWPVRRAI